MSTPTINYFPQKFRGVTSSLDYNTFCKNAMEDISSLYKMVSTQESMINEYYKILSLQQIYMQNQYQVLLSKYDNMSNMLESYSNEPPQATNVYISYYDSKNVSFGGFQSYPALPVSERCSLNQQYGLLMPHIYESQSRIYIYDNITRQSFLPLTVDNYKITETGEGIVRLKNPDHSSVNMKPLRYAYDGLTDTYWYIEAKYASTAVDSMEVQLDLPLPIDVISSLDCNYILIEPFPSFATEIVGIYYTSDHKSCIIGDASNYTNASGITSFTSKNTTKWTQVPVNTTPLYQIRNHDTKVVFPTMPITGIRVHLKTSVFTLESGLRTFIVGVRNIDCGFARFSPGKALTKLSVGDKSIKNVINPQDTNNTSNIDYKLYYDYGTGDIVKSKFNYSLPSGVKTVYVETDIKEAASLYGLNLRYNVY